MVVYRQLSDVEPVKNAVLTIGSYDGLHRGHQEIINRVVATASATGEKSVVITFDPHPKQVLDTSGDTFELLMHIDKKLQLLEKMSVDITLVIPFSLEFSRTTAQDFLDRIVMKYFSPGKVVVGYDHRFGHNREGDSIFLRESSKNGLFELEVISSVKDQDETLSSGRIRRLIREGYVRRASFELGWVYGFDAIVVRGSGRGHGLDFPTANFVPKNSTQLLPKRGVYFARGIVHGRCVYGMCNIGFRPTFEENEFVLEIHFFDESIENLYGETIEVQFLERIRDEKKFDSSQGLVEQLRRDKEYCVSRINAYREE